MALKVNEMNNHAHIPQHVRGIVAAVIEEAKAYRNGELAVVHDRQFQRTRLMFRDGETEVLAHANLSHTIYPEETIVASFEDHRNPKMVSLDPRQPTVANVPVPNTTTRHYQPKNYLGKNAQGESNSRDYATDVSRLDEANIAVDIFNFIRTGNLPT